jgi:hypothetical protein
VVVGPLADDPQRSSARVTEPSSTIGAHRQGRALVGRRAIIITIKASVSRRNQREATGEESSSSDVHRPGAARRGPDRNRGPLLA